jgi:hypothetical protein
MNEQPTQVVKADVRVASAAQDLPSGLLVPATGAERNPFMFDVTSREQWVASEKEAGTP